ncbi:hypothetical protein L1987_76778 [Smallanthus sonchifolius]|uniref:Uncharacterized protein n=1 Tax=Smallanthus sonchifolius TaxID=185202 RepID=A0ACB8Z8L8_9ASTR|nr:hypothetical protein L1987_76778 [Smallanthus sonchifolius]
MYVCMIESSFQHHHHSTFSILLIHHPPLNSIIIDKTIKLKIDFPDFNYQADGFGECGTCIWSKSTWWKYSCC